MGNELFHQDRKESNTSPRACSLDLPSAEQANRPLGRSLGVAKLPPARAQKGRRPIPDPLKSSPPPVSTDLEEVCRCGRGGRLLTHRILSLRPVKTDRRERSVGPFGKEGCSRLVKIGDSDFPQTQIPAIGICWGNSGSTIASRRYLRIALEIKRSVATYRSRA